MFRRVFEDLTEPYQDVAQGTQQLQTYFNVTLPNAVLSQDNKFPLSDLSKTGNQQLTETKPIAKDEYVKLGLNGDLLGRRQAACENTQGRDAFDHLTNLVSSQEPLARARCGWMYNVSNPQDGKGAFGIESAPWKTDAEGTWMWDLADAKRKVHIDLCRQVEDCDDLATYPYKGRCAWCKSSGKAVPVVGGRLAYPSDPNCTCGVNNLAKSTSECPRPNPVIYTPEGASQRKTCDPREDGTFTRDCYIVKARQAGCRDQGTLIQALRSGSDMNYLDTLEQNFAYKTYQNRARQPVSESILRQGKASLPQALNEFRRINAQGASRANQGLAFAARDLCLNAGEIDKFDFCVELTDSTNPPFSLDCLQKEFLRAGGQRTGLLFPAPDNIAKEWNSQTTWGAVKRKILMLRDLTKSDNRIVQEDAMDNFLGVPLENKTQPLYTPQPGVETFYFTYIPHDPKQGIFLGRRITPTIPTINQNMDINGRRGQGNKNDNITVLYLTNVVTNTERSIRVRVTGDDGYVLVYNKPFYGSGGWKFNKPWWSWWGWGWWWWGWWSEERRSADYGRYKQESDFGASYPRSTNGTNGEVSRQWLQPPTSEQGKCSGWDVQIGDKCYQQRYSWWGWGGWHVYDDPQGTSPCFKLTPNRANIIKGFWYNHYGGLFSKVEYADNCANTPRSHSWQIGGEFKEFSPAMCSLTQEAFAPMISFEVENNDEVFLAGTNYNFMDRRLGDMKIQWRVDAAAPTIQYWNRSWRNRGIPRGNGAMTVNAGQGLAATFGIKMHSFMTMTLCCEFQQVPGSGGVAANFHMAPTGSLSYLQIRILGSGDYSSGTLAIYDGSQGTISVDDFPIKTNTPYLIVFEVLREQETDMNSMYGCRIGIGKLTDLQNDPTAITYSQPVRYANRMTLENPDSGDFRQMYIRGDVGWTIYWNHFFDYALKGDNLKREARNNWTSFYKNPA